MTVKELIARLSKMPQDLPVFLRVDDEGDVVADYLILPHVPSDPEFDPDCLPCIVIRGRE